MVLTSRLPSSEDQYIQEAVVFHYNQTLSSERMNRLTF